MTWTCKGQVTTALSTLESEFMALALNVKEVLWARQLFSSISRPQTQPTPVFVDNQAAIQAVEHPTSLKNQAHCHQAILCEGEPWRGD